MPTTDTFYVSLKDNKVRRTKGPSQDYFDLGAKHEGKAKYLIQVFGDNNEKVAHEVRDMIDKAGMQDKLFTIRVSTR
jgi:hypothetical protein